MCTRNALLFRRHISFRNELDRSLRARWVSGGRTYRGRDEDPTTTAGMKVNPSDENNQGILGFFDPGEGAGATRTGRAWRTSELRLKSYEDLHTLWFVLLRERNVLVTEKEWCRSNGRHWVNGQSNLYKVKRSMARIKGVVGERLRALQARKKLAEKSEVKVENAQGLANIEENKHPPGISTRT